MWRRFRRKVHRFLAQPQTGLGLMGTGTVVTLAAWGAQLQAKGAILQGRVDRDDAHHVLLFGLGIVVVGIILFVMHFFLEEGDGQMTTEQPTPQPPGNSEQTINQQNRDNSGNISQIGTANGPVYISQGPAPTPPPEPPADPVLWIGATENVGWLRLENSGPRDRFSLDIILPNDHELRCVWPNGTRDQVLRHGERSDWFQAFHAFHNWSQTEQYIRPALFRLPISPSIEYINTFRENAVKMYYFNMAPQAAMFARPGVQCGFRVVVLSDLRDAFIQEVTYGFTRYSRVVMPYNAETIAVLDAQDDEEVALYLSFQQSDSDTEENDC